MRLLWLAAFAAPFILLLSTGAAGYSELIIGENFSVDFHDAGHGVDCSGINEAYKVETLRLPAADSREFSGALKKISEAKVYLGSAKVAADLQKNWLLKIIPGMYNNLGSQCVYYGVQSTRRGVSALHEVGLKIDEKLQELEFEIGKGDFNGPGVRELQEAKEAASGKGPASKGISEINTAVASTIESMPSASIAKIAGESAALLISKNGPGAKLLAFHTNLSTALEQLKEEEEQLEIQAKKQLASVEKRIGEVEKKGAEKLGALELQKIREQTGYLKGIEGVETQGNGIAELVQEAKTLYSQAEETAKAPKGKEKGRSARRINDLRTAGKTLQLAQSAVDRAENAMAELAKALELSAIQAREKAQEGIQNAVSPTRRRMAEAVMAVETPQAKNLGQQLSNMVEEMKRAELALNLATEQTATLKQRIETKSKVAELQKQAIAAQREDIETTQEATQLSEIAKTLEQPLTQEELLATQGEIGDIEAELAWKLEEKFGWLRGELQHAVEISQNLETPDKAKLEEMRRALDQPNLLNAAGSIGNVEKTLAQLLKTAEKETRKLESEIAQSTNETIKKTEANMASEAPVADALDQQMGFLKEEITGALNEYRNIAEVGTRAFYSEKNTRKPLAGITFANSEKNTGKIATQLEKLRQKQLSQVETQRAQELLSSLREGSEKMQSAIDDIETQAALEVALASERQAEGEVKQQVEKADSLLKEGKFTQALTLASEANKQLTQQQQMAQPSVATAYAVSTGGDYREWAVAGSIAVILIGAAYLFLKKKQSEQEMV